MRPWAGSWTCHLESADPGTEAGKRPVKKKTTQALSEKAISLINFCLKETWSYLACLAGWHVRGISHWLVRVMVSLVSLTGLLNRTAMWHATSERLGETTKRKIRYDNMQLAKISKEWQPIRNSHKPSRNSVFNSWISDEYPKGFDMQMCHSLALH